MVDGTANPWVFGDVAVRGDRIVASVRIPADFPARRTIDAKGMVVAPGTDPLDLFLDFLAQEDGKVSTIYAHHIEADMNLALARPRCSIGPDGSALSGAGTRILATSDLPAREGGPPSRAKAAHARRRRPQDDLAQRREAGNQ